MKKFLLCLIFFGFSPIILGLTIYLAGFYSNKLSFGRILGEAVVSPQPANNFFAAYPEETGVVASVIKAESSVPIVIEGYLRYYHSPLLPYKDKILAAAEEYGVKPQLVVAIAQQESNLGKKSPTSCFNAWGWAIHEKGTRCFADWDEAIETVTQGIAEGYCRKGLCDDPCLMMKKYTPKSNGSWCAAINQFLQEMEMNSYENEHAL